MQLRDAELRDAAHEVEPKVHTINDIGKSSDLFKFILFADDITVFFAVKNIEMLSKTMNTEIDKVSNWIIANKLTININTNFLIFKSRQKKLMKENLNIKIMDESITQRQSIKFLGKNIFIQFLVKFQGL